MCILDGSNPNENPPDSRSRKVLMICTDLLNHAIDLDLDRNAINYRDNHKHRDAITINTEMQQK